jgi:hypothetical protein
MFTEVGGGAIYRIKPDHLAALCTLIEFCRVLSNSRHLQDGTAQLSLLMLWPYRR